jgi:hypothetical protein
LELIASGPRPAFSSHLFLPRNARS